MFRIHSTDQDGTIVTDCDDQKDILNALAVFDAAYEYARRDGADRESARIEAAFEMIDLAVNDICRTSIIRIIEDSKK